MEIIKYSNIGCREINQDCLASLSFDHDKSIHIVADDIGGYDCGEIASKIVCESYIHGLVNNLSIGEVTKEVSKNIQERVKFNLENQLGIKAETVNVYVQNIKVVGEN